LRYKRGQYDPKIKLRNISNVYFSDLILSMIDVDPLKRPDANIKDWYVI
jgi:hypothetical protein